MAVVALLALGAVLALTGLASRARPVGAGAPTGALTLPAALPSAPAVTAAEPTIAPRDGHAGMFVVPFTYTLPAGVGLTISVDHLGFYQFRHNVGGQDYDAGIIVRAVAGGRKDPCSESSAALNLAGPREFIDYFETVPTLTVNDIVPTTVDDRAAITASLEFGDATAACPNVWLWAEEGSITETSGRASPRVTMVDVGTVHVAILVFGGGDFLSSADSFIASIHFETAAQTSS